jgi:hypothetical protein
MPINMMVMPMGFANGLYDYIHIRVIMHLKCILKADAFMEQNPNEKRRG